MNLAPYAVFKPTKGYNSELLLTNAGKTNAPRSQRTITFQCHNALTASFRRFPLTHKFLSKAETFINERYQVNYKIKSTEDTQSPERNHSQRVQHKSYLNQ